MLKRLFICLTIIVLFFGALYVYKCVYISSVNKSDVSYNIYIKNHDTLSSVITHLDNKSKLDSKNIAILYARILGVDSRLAVGEYEITPNTNLHDIIEKFISSDVVVHKFTIVEGWNSYQLMAALAGEENLEHVTPSMDSVSEGEYFPDTYFYSYPDTDLDILKRASDKMKSVLVAEFEHRNKDIRLASEYEALIIASLIEKEALDNNEKYEISGVIQNRLKKNMRLQIDAGVYYGLVQKYMGKIDRPLAVSDIKDKSNIYNTYAYKGLPPGPIAMPSLASIRAACNPKDNKYLYYVVKNDDSNTHYFSLNFKDHKKAIRKHLQHS